MKKYKCHECEAEFQAETREEMLSALYDHYIKDHNEVVSNVTEEEKKAWMERFEKGWKEAEEI